VNLKSLIIRQVCNRKSGTCSKPALNSGSFVHSITRLLYFSGYLYIVLFSLVFSSCSEKSADHEKFVNAYVDIRLAEDTIKSNNTNIQKVKAEILKKYGLTLENYKASFEYFNNNPELWEQFYDKAIARVDSLKQKK